MRTSGTYRQREPNHASLTPVPGGLAWSSPYDPSLVNAFKSAVPSEARRWDGTAKRWIIDAQYGAIVAKITEAYLGVVMTVPSAIVVPSVETRLVKLMYLGATKDRGNGEASAYGYVDGGWNLIIPETVLRDWFEAVPQRPDEKPTLYAVLAVKPSATMEEVKSAYRRLAKQWHPDVAKEVDAAEVFKAISQAYQVLVNEVMRRKYDAGRALEASLKQQPSQHDRDYSALFKNAYSGYRAPLRCGWLLCEGQELLGRFAVSKVLQWEDQVNEHGQTLVTSWTAGSDMFTENWV